MPTMMRLDNEIVDVDAVLGVVQDPPPEHPLPPQQALPTPQAIHQPPAELASHQVSVDQPLCAMSMPDLARQSSPIGDSNTADQQHCQNDQTDKFKEHTAYDRAFPPLPSAPPFPIIPSNDHACASYAHMVAPYIFQNGHYTLPPELDYSIKRYLASQLEFIYGTFLQHLPLPASNQHVSEWLQQAAKESSLLTEYISGIVTQALVTVAIRRENTKANISIATGFIRTVLFGQLTNHCIKLWRSDAKHRQQLDESIARIEQRRAFTFEYAPGDVLIFKPYPTPPPVRRKPLLDQPHGQRHSKSQSHFH